MHIAKFIDINGNPIQGVAYINTLGETVYSDAGGKLVIPRDGLVKDNSQTTQVPVHIVMLSFTPQTIS